MLLRAVGGVCCWTIVSATSLAFWTVIKSIGYRRRILSDRELVCSFLDIVGLCWIEEGAELVRAEGKAYSKRIRNFLRRHDNDACGTANVLALAVLATSVLAARIHPLFLLICLTSAMGMAIVPLGEAVKDQVLSQISWLAFHLHRWNLDDPIACSRAISESFPQLSFLFEALQREDWIATAASGGRYTIQNAAGE